MVDEKPNKYSQTDSLPVPTYEESQEASRPSSSQSFLGPSEVSHDAERQGLLGRSHGIYRAPTVESARSSLDLLPSSENSPRVSTEALRREIQQMDVVEPQEDETNGAISARAIRISKHFTNFTHSLSSINLPFRQLLPSREYILAKIPALIRDFKPNWILAGRFFALLLVLFLAYLLFLSDIFTTGRRKGPGMGLDYPNSIRAYARDQMNESNIREHAKYVTSFPHVAGTEGGFALAEYVQNIFINSHLEDVRLEQFDVYLNYPKDGGRRVAILEPSNLAWEARIEEDVEQYPVFHGHSRSGTAKGHLIYANYGSREDFNWLKKQAVDLKGAIVLVRYYGSQGDRGLKVKAAELAGASGCIIYSDPAEDGFKKGKPYPDGRYMPSDGVQRGAVSLMSWVVGDVLSPGFASLPGEQHRDSKEDSKGLNQIPSLPLAWRDAQKLLQALKGHGMKLDDKWVGGVPDIDEWWSGDSTSPLVELMNEQDEVDRRPIYNVIGRITGVEQPEKSIIIGNHRDAWCLGASDPGSGTATLLEIVRVLGDLANKGWRPLRTIEFASWDGEEHNLIGSTEHVEAQMDELRRNGIAYLNVDVAVTGSDFQASASPVLQTAMLRAMEIVADPVKNKTLRALWAERGSILQGLGAGSDYVAFQDMAGTSSLDMGFSGAAFPYHSCYDNFDWMENFGDPGFQYHRALAQLWALLTLELADRELLPFDFEVYASAVQNYVKDLENYVEARKAQSRSIDLMPLHRAADEFVKNAAEFHAWGKAWEQAIGGGGFESNTMAIKRMSHNSRMGNFETHLLDVNGGLPGREQFKHVIFAPQAWSGYDEAYFPGIRDAIDAGDWSLAQEQVDKVANIISYASNKLNH
ncbi:hypothetical protein ACLMJK_003155 [Lecanora helva]